MSDSRREQANHTHDNDQRADADEGDMFTWPVSTYSLHPWGARMAVLAKKGRALALPRRRHALLCEKCSMTACDVAALRLAGEDSSFASHLVESRAVAGEHLPPRP